VRTVLDGGVGCADDLGIGEDGGLGFREFSFEVEKSYVSTLVTIKMSWWTG
jgi:hypothetical protein